MIRRAPFQVPERMPGALLRTALLVLLTAPSVTHADASWSPYAKVIYDHDSNIFAFPTYSPELPPGTLTAMGDSRESYVGGADVREELGRQTLRATLEGRRVEYGHFSDLSHYESLAAGSLDYQLGNLVDGIVRASQQKRMAAFTDRVSDVLAIETERKAFASMRFRITPDWYLQPDVSRRDLTSPQQLYPDLRLREDSYGGILTYAGLGSVRVGLDANHLTGVYTGAVDIPKVKQDTIQLTVDYQASGLSSFKGAIGHTSRDQGVAIMHISDLTGSLAYRRQLTGKTAVNLEVSRAVNSYITAGSSEIDTRENVTIEWQATRKTAVKASYVHTHGVFVGDFIPGQAIPGRKDDFGTTRLNVDYRALRWLSIQPYFQYQRRNSTDLTLTFRGTLVGVEVTARLFDEPH